MSRTIVVEFSLTCAYQVCKALEKAQKEVACYHNTEKAEDNYGRGCTFAYLDCAIAAIKEAINEG